MCACIFVFRLSLKSSQPCWPTQRTTYTCILSGLALSMAADCCLHTVDNCERELLEGEVDAYRAITDHRAGTLEQSLLVAFHDVACGACKRSYIQKLSVDEVHE